MKKVNQIISSRNLTPKELAYLPLYAFIQSMQHEKHNFSSDEIKLAIRNWKPRNNTEIIIYNELREKVDAFYEDVLLLEQVQNSILLILSEITTIVTVLLYAPDKSIQLFINQLPEQEKICLDDVFITNIDTCRESLSKEDYLDIFRLLYIERLIENKNIQDMLQRFFTISKKTGQYSEIFDIDTTFISNNYYYEIKQKVTLLNLLTSQIILNLEKKNTKINLDMFFFNPFIDLEGVENSPDLNHSESI